MSRKNLKKVVEQATPEDWQYARAAWYRYQQIVGDIAKSFGFPMEIGAAVFSSLSPNNDYLGNIRDTATLLRAAAGGKQFEDFKVSTYHPNKRKAWRIANGEKPLDLIIAQKTRNFYLNVVDPADPKPVTVDGHILNAWSGKRIALHSAVRAVRIKTSHQHYEDVADDIRAIGKARGELPNVIQGVIWYCWKRVHRIRYAGDQMAFWHDDKIVAGLGFIPDAKIEPAESLPPARF